MTGPSKRFWRRLTPIGFAIEVVLHATGAQAASAQAGPAPTVEGGCAPSRSGSLEPLRTLKAGAITYCDGGDGAQGQVTLRLSPQDLSRYDVVYAGYPDNSQVRLQLRNDQGQTRDLTVEPAGETWQPLPVHLPEGWSASSPISIVLTDQSSAWRGWAGLGYAVLKPAIQGGCAASRSQSLAPMSALKEAAITYCDGGDAAKGKVTLRMPLKDLRQYQVVYAGYPDNGQVRIQLRNDQGETRDLQVPAAGEAWRPLDVHAPKEWSSASAISIVLTDQSAAMRGWAGLGYTKRTLADYLQHTLWGPAVLLLIAIAGTVLGLRNRRRRA